MTTPLWTSLFQDAKAIITDTGGILSHARLLLANMGFPPFSAHVQQQKDFRTETSSLLTEAAAKSQLSAGPDASCLFLIQAGQVYTCPASIFVR